MYEELIMRLMEDKSWIEQGTTETEHEIADHLQKAADAIEELEKAVHRWIPVTERLPEEEKKRYWVCTDTEYQCECRWTNNRFGMGEFDEWGWSIFDIPQYSHVVAWMPLPEPPEEVTQDD